MGPAWFVDGVDDDQVAFVLRVHHVLADGMSLFGAAMLLMDFEPQSIPTMRSRGPRSRHLATTGSWQRP